MNGLSGLNKSPVGVVLGMVQLQLPNMVTPDDHKFNFELMCAFVDNYRLVRWFNADVVTLLMLLIETS